jgi:hypothetical protein
VKDAIVVWDGRETLVGGIERDYADMRGDGWDLIWQPTSPLTTPWEQYSHLASPDPNQYAEGSSFDRAKRVRRAAKGADAIAKDWTSEYTGQIAQRSRR